jgi:hypothetical protein
VSTTKATPVRRETQAGATFVQQNLQAIQVNVFVGPQPAPPTPTPTQINANCPHCLRCSDSPCMGDAKPFLHVRCSLCGKVFRLRLQVTASSFRPVAGGWLHSVRGCEPWHGNSVVQFVDPASQDYELRPGDVAWFAYLGERVAILENRTLKRTFGVCAEVRLQHQRQRMLT